MSTIIVGGGIIGISTAFFLSEKSDPTNIHVIESSERPFSSASGFAGGFVAPDWFSYQVLPLGELSFALHKRLADKYEGRNQWGYNRSTSLSLTEQLVRKNSSERGDDWLFSGTSRAQVASSGDGYTARENDAISSLKGPSWLRFDGAHYDALGTSNSCAQVDPLRLCQFLLAKCKERGVHFHKGAVVSKTVCDDAGRLNLVEISRKSGDAEADPNNSEPFTLTCKSIVIAAGAWSQPVFASLFPAAKTRLPVRSLAGYSLTFKSPSWTRKDANGDWHAVFSGGMDDAESDFSAELFARLGGLEGGAEIYIAGLNDETLAPPPVATGAPADAKSIDILRRKAISMLSAGGEISSMNEGHRTSQTRERSSFNPDDLEIVRTGLCWRPITNKGYPIVSKIPDHVLGDGIKTSSGGGVWVAAGHGPWGISLSLGTGMVISEMVLGKPTSCDVSGLALSGQ